MVWVSQTPGFLFFQIMRVDPSTGAGTVVAEFGPCSSPGPEPGSGVQDRASIDPCMQTAYLNGDRAAEVGTTCLGPTTGAVCEPRLDPA